MSDELALRVLRAMAFDYCGEVFWRTDGIYAPVTFMIICSDEFAYAQADAETVTADNVAELERALADCHALDDRMHGPLLFCARVRRRRPVAESFKHMEPAVRALFDAIEVAS